MNNSKPDGTDNAHGIGAIANMEPLFQGFRTIQSNKGLHRATIQELADSGRAIRRELDSLIAILRSRTVTPCGLSGSTGGWRTL